ncbi:SDR family NAD(P)-dependent oxidoreductase, partial [Acinetobacter baumannii]
GQALAVCYARPGRTLALSGRDAGRLAAVTDLCQAPGARVLSLAVDVTDRQAMAEWLDAVDAAAPVDLVIANAGIAAGAGPEDQDRAQD